MPNFSRCPCIQLTCVTLFISSSDLPAYSPTPYFSVFIRNEEAFVTVVKRPRPQNLGRHHFVRCHANNVVISESSNQ
jgi:hypothetical protein